MLEQDFLRKILHDVIISVIWNDKYKMNVLK